VNDKLVEQETLIDGIGRIRDIEVDADGTLLLLIENAAGGKILRLRPGD
jgi:glucose/arabinose dehydrogenase